MIYETIPEYLQAAIQPLSYIYAAYARSTGDEDKLKWLQELKLPEDLQDVRALWDTYVVLQAELQQNIQETAERGAFLPLFQVLRMFELGEFAQFVITLALAFEIMPEHQQALKVFGQRGITLSFALLLYSASWEERLCWQIEWLREEYRVMLLLDVDGQTGQLRLNPTVLRFFLGLPISCNRAEVFLPSDALPDSLGQSVQTVIQRQIARNPIGNLFMLRGEEGVGRRYQVKQYMKQAGSAIVFIKADDILEKQSWVTDIKRFVKLLCADVCVYNLRDDAKQIKAAQGLIETLSTPQAFVTAAAPVQWIGGTYTVTEVEVSLQSTSQRSALWKQLLPEIRIEDCDMLAARYEFSIGRVLNAAKKAGELAAQQESELSTKILHHACKQQLPKMISSMAVPITQGYAWEDLILPAQQMQLLRHIVSQVQYRERVMEEWGMGAKLAYGRGVRAIFSGAPGTGKTMAAQVLAAQLHMELYKVNLSMLVSKYIGDTEKNLEMLFAEARQSAGILFFDEADALFGKRGEQKDSHDKYANMQTAFLLQKFEDFDGVAILATNYILNLDVAFTRRIQNRIEFPKPSVKHREQIWNTMLLPSAPFDAEIDTGFLAQAFDLTGAEIKNSVMQAAYFSAALDKSIGMAEIVRALLMEFSKMDKMVPRSVWGRYAYMVDHVEDISQNA